MDGLASLGPAAYHLNYLWGNPSINVTDQIFLALMKCRMYKTNVELSRMFRSSDTRGVQHLYYMDKIRVATGEGVGHLARARNNSGRSCTFGKREKQSARFCTVHLHR